MTQPRNLGAFADNVNSSGQVSLTTGVTGSLPVANGGTGTTSTTFVNLATNVTGTLPIANGGTGSTSTTFVSLTTNVSGTLPVANGGTGQTSLASVTVGSATSATSATTATNIASGGAGQVPYNTGSGATSFLAAGTSGQFLKSNGTSAPSWGCAGSSTTYGAVGTYVTAFIRSGACFVIFSPGCTIAGACLYRTSNAITACSGVSQGGAMNTFNRPSYGATMVGNKYDCGSYFTSLGLSGTWRAMTTSRQYNCGGYKQLSLFVRVS